MIREISRAELGARLAAGEPVLVVDVRSAEELLAILAEHGTRVAEIEADPTCIARDHLIVTVCGKGGGRSEGAARRLAESGTAEVGFLEGGTLGWLADAEK